MNNIFKFIFLYLIVIFAVFAFYLSISDNLKKELTITKQESSGVEYLKSMYKIAIYAAVYQGFWEVKDSKKNIETSQVLLQSEIENIYALQKKYPQFKSDEFNYHLEKIKSSKMNAEANYNFFESINNENYKIGDISNLFFEKDRKTYFLVSLVTHYMPEFLISILINHNIAEEFQATNSLSDYKIAEYAEQNKLIYLSSQEINSIMKMLIQYDDTKNLRTLKETIREKIKLFPKDKNSFFNKNGENVSVKDYLNWSHDILELAYKLNDEHILILESTLRQKATDLEEKILKAQLVFTLIFALTSVILFYFYLSRMENIKKDIEIKKVNDMLDHFVVFSKTDTKGRITYISSAFEELSGYSLDEIKGKTFKIVNNKKSDRAIFKGLWETITKKKTWTGELTNVAKDGSEYSIKSIITPDLNSSGELIGYIAYSSNITDIKKLEKMKDDYELLATTDSLTKIHNRYSLMKILSSEISRAKRYNTPLSVCMLDIDFFKKVNDTYGHDIGDVVLSTLSELIKNSLRDMDIVGRYGGEEFIILLPNTELMDANIYAERFRELVENHIFNTVGNITISMGLVQLENDENIDELFKRLDNLLYESKHNGRNRVSF